MQEAEQADDPELLMAVLETREALEEAETEDDVASIRAENKGASLFALLAVDLR